MRCSCASSAFSAPVSHSSGRLPGTVSCNCGAPGASASSASGTAGRSRYSMLMSSAASCAMAALLPTTIATGEIACGRWYHKELLDKGGAEILQTDAVVCGGITEWKRIAATAASYGVTMCPHWFHDLHVHLVAATPNARYVDFFIDDQVLNFRRLIDTQLKYKDGDLLLPQTPGLGFNFDEKAVKKYALDKQHVWTTIK